MKPFKGNCICGAVTVSAKGVVDHSHACHCKTCRAQNAGGAFHGAVFSGGADINGDSLKWYKSSDYAERGFCGVCGSTIAWRVQGASAPVVLSLGLFKTTVAKIEEHIFSDQAGDYYALGTDVPHKTGQQVFEEFEAQQAGGNDA